MRRNQQRAPSIHGSNQHHEKCKHHRWNLLRCSQVSSLQHNSQELRQYHVKHHRRNHLLPCRRLRDKKAFRCIHHTNRWVRSIVLKRLTRTHRATWRCSQQSHRRRHSARPIMPTKRNSHIQTQHIHHIRPILRHRPTRLKRQLQASRSTRPHVNLPHHHQQPLT